MITRSILRPVLRPVTRAVSDTISGFNPRSLFASGEQGALYDLYDQSTLFQDAAGTTPWTTLGQPLGLQLDKSKGLVLGSELKGGGTVGLVGTATAATYDTTTGAGAVTRVDGANQSFVNFTATINSFYQMRISVASGTVQVRAGTYTGTVWAAVTAGTTVTVTVPCLAGSVIALSTPSGTATFTVSSVRELHGNHRYQTTPASRPTIEARVNLYTKSEFPGGITDAPIRAGLVTGASLPNWLGRFTTGIAFGHDGLITSYVYMGSAVASAQHTFSVFVKMDDGNAPSFGSASAVSVANDFALIVSGLAVSPLTYAVTSVGDGVYRVSATITSGIITLTSNGVAKYNTNSSRTFKVTGYQLELGSAATTYQSVTTATDYADIGAPRRIKYDGIDDFLQTASIDFSATDKMTVWAGVRKLSDAAQAVICELSTNATTTNGAFVLSAPASAAANFSFASRGTALSTQTTAGHAAPISRVLTGVGNIAGDVAALSVNAVSATSSTDQGTGNYGTYPIYFGARGGTSLRFSGEVFSPEVIRGAASTAAQIDIVERIINRNMGGVY
jgi:hypothetical protein